MTFYSPHQQAWLAHNLTLEGKAEESLTKTMAGAKVDMNPHQIEAAMFALASPCLMALFWPMKLDWGKRSRPAWFWRRNGLSVGESF